MEGLLAEENSKKIAEMQSRYENEKKEKEMAQLSRKINKKALGMMEKAEKQYEELMKKRGIIEKDRSKIQAVIAELDEKKNKALQETWVKVNRDFGSVFSALLPGTQAKLEPPEGGSVLDGLEVSSGCQTSASC
jgi:structural maintenance of chromosome 2